jgi:hypothetical protein
MTEALAPAEQDAVRLLARLFLVGFVLFTPLGWHEYREGAPGGKAGLSAASGRLAGFEQLMRTQTNTTSRNDSKTEDGMLLRTLENPTGYRVEQDLWRALGPGAEELLRAPKGTPVTMVVDPLGRADLPSVYALRAGGRIFLPESDAADLRLARGRDSGFGVLAVGGLGLALMTMIILTQPWVGAALSGHGRELCVWVLVWALLMALAESSARAARL